MRKFAFSLCLAFLVQVCVSARHAADPTGPALSSHFQTVPLFENTIPVCGFDVIEPITLDEPLDSPRAVEQVTARAMFLGGDALILLPSFSPMNESPQGRASRCSLAVIKFRKWTCKH